LQRELDAEFFGLKGFKARIVDYVRTRRLLQKNKKDGEENEDAAIKKVHATILGIESGHGMAKTAIGDVLARSLNRGFSKLDIPTATREMLRGEAFSERGAQPCFFTLELIRHGYNNPVILINEIDKAPEDAREAIYGILTKALDPADNSSFRDTFLNIDVDLSNVLFIVTGNDLSKLPQALKSRIQPLNIPPYLLEEKIAICRRPDRPEKSLIQKAEELAGLKPGSIDLSDEILKQIIEGYNREPGIRGTLNSLTVLFRGLNYHFEDGRTNPHKVSEKDLRSILGRLDYLPREQITPTEPGFHWGLSGGIHSGSVDMVEVIVEKPDLLTTQYGAMSPVETMKNQDDSLSDSLRLARKYFVHHFHEIARIVMPPQFGGKSLLLPYDRERDIDRERWIFANSRILGNCPPLAEKNRWTQCRN